MLYDERNIFISLGQLIKIYIKQKQNKNNMGNASMLVCLNTTRQYMVLIELKQLGYVEIIPTSTDVDFIVADNTGNIYTYHNNCGVKHYESMHNCKLVTTDEKVFISSCKRFKKLI